MARLSVRLSGTAMTALLVVGAGLVAFAGGLVGAPSAPLPDITQATRNEWRDLAPRADHSAGDLGILASRRPWGATAVDPAAAAAAAAAAAGQGGGLRGVSNAVPWRVSGVARQGGRFLAVLTRSPQGQPSESDFLQVGDKLPDGRTITGIDADAVEVDGGGGQRQRIRLYWPKT